ncbi:thioredoxin b [Corythoichthys intestinalis]|uniref:thioredoxin b n=1 Tax=Corythoichthys intestinalis TaxID=161448 RepID=UPI0025A4E9AC|nr:thioredoxin [Corythoichthys intestinalis]
MVKQVQSLEEFEEILKTSGDKLVVVDFTATWCGPCRMISPKFEEFSHTYTNVVFIKVDVDECDDVAQKHGISAMPTFLFFKNGKKVDDFTGANADKLLERIQKYLN